MLIVSEKFLSGLKLSLIETLYEPANHGELYGSYKLVCENVQKFHWKSSENLLEDFQIKPLHCKTCRRSFLIDPPIRSLNVYASNLER